MSETDAIKYLCFLAANMYLLAIILVTSRHFLLFVMAALCFFVFALT